VVRKGSQPASRDTIASSEARIMSDVYKPQDRVYVKTLGFRGEVVREIPATRNDPPNEKV